MDVAPWQGMEMGEGGAQSLATRLPGGTENLEEGECSIILTRTGQMGEVKHVCWSP